MSGSLLRAAVEAGEMNVFFFVELRVGVAFEVGSTGGVLSWAGIGVSSLVASSVKFEAGVGAGVLPFSLT